MFSWKYQINIAILGGEQEQQKQINDVYIFINILNVRADKIVICFCNILKIKIIDILDQKFMTSQKKIRISRFNKAS